MRVTRINDFFGIERKRERFEMLPRGREARSSSARPAEAPLQQALLSLSSSPPPTNPSYFSYHGPLIPLFRWPSRCKARRSGSRPRPCEVSSSPHDPDAPPQADDRSHLFRAPAAGVPATMPQQQQPSMLGGVSPSLSFFRRTNPASAPSSTRSAADLPSVFSGEP